MSALSNLRGWLVKILVNNFFHGVLQRGIPIYTENLCIALRQQGCQVEEWRCPTWLHRVPRGLLNVLFVLFEQCLMPIRGLLYDKVVYPYNTVALLGAGQRRSLLVVHDFIPNRRRDTSLAARYVKTCQYLYAAMAGEVAYVSRTTARVAQLAGLFRRSRAYLFPNAFWTFRQAYHGPQPAPHEAVLLCSGSGSNKDLAGALALYRDSGMWQRYPLYILGLAGDSTPLAASLQRWPELAARLTVLPRLDNAEVVRHYLQAPLVWVHSRREGYGRSIAEAKLCAKPVLASRIPPFVQQKDDTVFLYANAPEFTAAWQALEQQRGAAVTPAEPREHTELLANTREWLQHA